MQHKITLSFKAKARKALAIIFITIFTSCMNMKHGMKPDLTNHGAGVVWIKKDNFSPGVITVPVNTTVTWTNKDFWPHTVTSDDGLFDSKKLKHGKTFSYTFKTKGTFKYHCKIHDRMIAKVIVE